MPRQESPQAIFVRLFGGADDDGILELPIIDGLIPIAVQLDSGDYYSTGFWDSTSKPLFAYSGTEGAILLRPEWAGILRRR